MTKNVFSLIELENHFDANSPSEDAGKGLATRKRLRSQTLSVKATLLSGVSCVFLADSEGELAIYAIAATIPYARIIEELQRLEKEG